MTSWLHHLRFIWIGLIPLVMQGCFFDLPQTFSPDISIGTDTTDILVDGVYPMDQLPSDTNFDSSTQPEMVWLPDETDAPGDADTESNPDGSGDTDSESDSGPAWPFECPYPPEAFSKTQDSSFVAFGEPLVLPIDPTIPPEQQYSPDKLYVYYLSCDLTQTSYGADRGFIVSIDNPGELSVNIQCNYPCYSFIFKDGCNYNNLKKCWYQQGNTVDYSLDVLPGKYIVAVEFVEKDLWDDTGVADYTKGKFDIHVAVEKSKGLENCQSESETNLDSLEPDCLEDGTAVWTVTVPGTLTWEHGDDFDLGCHAYGVMADATGGMPDLVHSLVLPQNSTEPLQVTASVEYPEFESAAARGAILGVTSSNTCGAADAVIDCAWGKTSSLAVSDVLAMPGDRIHAVLDGMGEDAFVWSGSTPYSLTWTVRGRCQSEQ